MSIDMWAVAALLIVDRAGTPLIWRTYTTSSDVLKTPGAPLQVHLYVGPEDITTLQFLLYASLDRCEELSSAIKAAREKAGTTSSRGAKGEAPSSQVTSVNPYEAQMHDLEDTPIPQSANTTTARGVTLGADVRFVGKLIQTHRFASYGFASATKIRTVVVTVGGDAPQDAMVPLCRAMYEYASAALCNPFRTPAQCWRAQEELLAEWQRDVQAADGMTPLLGVGGRFILQETQGGPDVSTGAFTSPISRLLSGMQEYSWPRAPPTTRTAADEPTLALSAVFHSQLENLLSPFVVTSRSCMI